MMSKTFYTRAQLRELNKNILSLTRKEGRKEEKMYVFTTGIRNVLCILLHAMQLTMYYALVSQLRCLYIFEIFPYIIICVCMCECIYIQGKKKNFCCRNRIAAAIGYSMRKRTNFTTMINYFILQQRLFYW